MYYAKKVLVLKQLTSGFSSNEKSVSGILRAETISGVCEIHLSLINLADSETEYQLVITDKNRQPFRFNLGRRPSSFSTVLENPPDFSQGLSAGILIVNSSIPLTVLFGRSDDCDFSVSDFKRLVADICIIERKDKRKKDEPICPPTIPPEYNDEAVATENYYDLDQKIQDKLQEVKEKENEYIRVENGVPFDRNKTEKDENCTSTNEFPYETNVDDGQKYSEDNPYFLSVKQELEELFLRFPEEECLPRYFFGSRWAKINYSENKYYVVGVIKENDKEKYICYGVPAKYSAEPPKELKGYCTFIPISIFDMRGEGYWMMFQDAVTGFCVKPMRQ